MGFWNRIVRAARRLLFGEGEQPARATQSLRAGPTLAGPDLADDEGLDELEELELDEPTEELGMPAPRIEATFSPPPAEPEPRAEWADIRPRQVLSGTPMSRNPDLDSDPGRDTWIDLERRHQPPVMRSRATEPPMFDDDEDMRPTVIDASMDFLIGDDFGSPVLGGSLVDEDEAYGSLELEDDELADSPEEDAFRAAAIAEITGPLPPNRPITAEVTEPIVPSFAPLDAVPAGTDEDEMPLPPPSVRGRRRKRPPKMPELGLFTSMPSSQGRGWDSGAGFGGEPRFGGLPGMEMDELTIAEREDEGSTIDEELFPLQDTAHSGTGVPRAAPEEPKGSELPRVTMRASPGETPKRVIPRRAGRKRRDGTPAPAPSASSFLDFAPSGPHTGGLADTPPTLIPEELDDLVEPSPSAEGRYAPRIHPLPSLDEITDISIDDFAWSDETAEFTMPVPEPESGKPRFPNSQGLSDEAIVETLRREHYPDVGDTDDATLYRLCRIEEDILQGAGAVGEALLKLTGEVVGEHELWQAAVWWSGLLFDHRVRDALQRCNDAPTDPVMRRVAWVSRPYLGELLLAATQDDDPAKLGKVVRRLERSIAQRGALVRKGPAELASELSRFPTSPRGLNRLQDFRWLDG